LDRRGVPGARAVFELLSLWDEVEALDCLVDAQAQLATVVSEVTQPGAETGL
jgi:hypothetical protein